MAAPAVSYEQLILDLPDLLQCPFKSDGEITPHRTQKEIHIGFSKTAALHQKSKLSLVYVIAS